MVGAASVRGALLLLLALCSRAASDTSAEAPLAEAPLADYHYGGGGLDPGAPNSGASNAAAPAPSAVLSNAQAMLASLEMGALEDAERHAPRRFDDSLLSAEAHLETVARFGDTTGGREESKDEALPRLIDAHDNRFVLTSTGAGLASQMSLLEDATLIRDLTLLVIAAAVGGFLAVTVGQPLLLGYLLAGAACGPGGFAIIEELVQVETVAQLGVLILMFCLGAEFELGRLGGVGGQALGSRAIQLCVLMSGGAALARAAGAAPAAGAFAGAYLCQSSTALVIKCLQEKRANGAAHSELTVALLIVQDIALGAGLGILPALAAGAAGVGGRAVRAGATAAALLLAAACGAMHGSARRAMSRLAAQRGEEASTLALVALCFASALIAQSMGLSLELGAFAGGLLVSARTVEVDSEELKEKEKPLAHKPHALLAHIEPVRSLFGALFLATIGMTMHPGFLWEHKAVLVACWVALVGAKSALITSSLYVCRVPRRTAAAAGLSLANVGELGFVLLSRARGLGILSRPLFLLLLGTTALSLCATPALVAAGERVARGRGRLLPVTRPRTR